jgi:hypothetical protein
MNAENLAPMPVPHLFSAPLTACPACHAERLVPVRDAGALHFACEVCGECWHFELGAVWRVDPATFVEADGELHLPS